MFKSQDVMCCLFVCLFLVYKCSTGAYKAGLSPAYCTSTPPKQSGWGGAVFSKLIFSAMGATNLNIC